MIWILQIIYFSFCLMNWKIEGGEKKKKLQWKNLSRAWEEARKPRICLKRMYCRLEEALDLIMHEMFPSA